MTDSPNGKFDPKVDLPNIVTDPRWQKRGRRRRYAVIGGKRIGVVYATKSPDYYCYALNKGDWNHLGAGVRAGKLDEAHVTWMRIGRAETYYDYTPFEEMQEKLRGLQPRTGQFGDFWTFPLNYVAGGDDDGTDDDPDAPW